MVILAALIIAFMLGYIEGKREEKLNMRAMLDLYFKTIEKKERDFRDRNRRKNQP